jgi:transposase
MGSPVRSDPKCDSLRRRATLNPHPERIRDALFLTHPFFDPRDLVQVKYELLHRVVVEDQPVGVTAAAFGCSRVTVHQLRKRFEAEGLAGLMPRRKGPGRASKLTEEVLAYIWQILKDEPDLRMADLPGRIDQQFGNSVHLRSVKRALKQSGKND